MHRKNNAKRPNTGTHTPTHPGILITVCSFQVDTLLILRLQLHSGDCQKLDTIEMVYTWR